MTQHDPIRVAITGYGVIGKRVASAVLAQSDMRLAGVADVAADWRLRPLEERGIDLYAATPDHLGPMRDAGLRVAATMEALLARADIVVDCTPKRIAAQNSEN